MKKSRIESLGMYVPKTVITTSDLMAQIQNKPEFDLEALTGIKSRRRRSETEDTYSISINAIKDCLKNSRYKAEDLDILITCSISRFTKDGEIVYEPSVSYILKEAIGATNAKFFSVGNACAGMGTGVHILNNMIKSGAVKNGMVMSGECITVATDTAVIEIKEPIDPQFASLTLGDAGAAVIMDVSPNPEEESIEYTQFMTMAEFSELCFGLPSNDTGNIAMYSDSIGIHRESISRLAQFVQSVFEKKMGRTDWDYSFNHVIPHQTSTKAMNIGQKVMTDYFQADQSYADRILVSRYIETLGNTASTSNFVVLYSGLRDGLMKKGHKVFIIIQASGIVFGAISIKIGDIKLDGCMEAGQ